jgi:hypothetical protein
MMRRQEVGAEVGGMSTEQSSYGAWSSRARRLSLGLLAASLLVAATAVGCGESDADKAQTQVCDARADLNKQVDKLASLTPATATVDGVSGALDAIKSDLQQISDAQGDLNDERKQEVESANQKFRAQLETVANDLGSNLSLSGAKAQVESAGKELASSYQQTFASVDCD